ncbi:phosphatidylinositol-glycan biosynthesis class X protein [Colias croceus]|uniref:phosphatidylinositol-glycan biosynthesis class X protein n=1 Tax=Colias crocea TaxID=72248 RepID=UPI001E27C199|nr:phosphatidylinositol-glycan biosynthesis class X protein [Colias croceus]
MSRIVPIYSISCSLLFILFFLQGTESNICKFNVRLKQTLHNEGFHRNITYEITFGTNCNDGESMLYEGCSVGLEQVLPAGVYSSPDEIEDARYKTITVFKNKVNIEAPAHESSPITVHLLGSVRDDSVFLYLPVHARYHRPVEGGGLARVDIPLPQLYLNCGSNKLDQCGIVPSKSNAFCPQSDKQCLWKEVPVQVSKPLVWNIPVGNTNHYNIVMFGTVVAVVLGSIYLLREIHCYKLQQKEKRR